MTVLDAALVGIVLTYVWRLQDMIPGLRQIHAVEIISVVAIIAFLAGGMRGMAEVVRHPVYRWSLFILLWMCLSVVVSLYPGHSFRFITEDHIKTFVLFTILAAGTRTFRHLERLLLFHIIGAIYYCFWSLTHLQPRNGRLHGMVYYDSNDFGLLIVCTLPICVYFMRRTAPSWQRVFGAAAAVLLLLMLVKTGSRGAFLGFITVTGAMLLWFRTFSVKVRMGTVLAMVLALTTVGSQQYWSMMGTLLNPSEDYNWVGGSRAGRMEVWKRGMGYMVQRPVLGVGVAAFYQAEGKMSELAELQRRGIGSKWSAPHNSFVQAGAELGVFGLLAFLAQLYAAQRAVRLAARESRLAGQPDADDVAAISQALAISILGFCVSGFFLTQAYSAFLYVWLALIIVLTRVTAAPIRAVRVRRHLVGYR